MKRTASVIAVCCMLTVASHSGAAGNADSGKGKAQPCAACHGADGGKPTGPDFPILAGQHADYLRKALLDYKSGARANPIMKGFADPLSRQDIEDLSAYFASQPSPLRSQR